jgi:hypothetical protein
MIHLFVVDYGWFSLTATLFAGVYLWPDFLSDIDKL